MPSILVDTPRIAFKGQHCVLCSPQRPLVGREVHIMGREIPIMGCGKLPKSQPRVDVWAT